MQIGIDYSAGAWQGAGIGRYTRDLVRAILAQGREHRYTLFFSAGWPGTRVPYEAELRALCRQYPNVRARPIPLPPRRLTQLWHRLHLPVPVELFTGPLDVLHAPDFVLPPTQAKRRIVTIHDLSYLVHPECALPSVARYLREAVPRSLSRAHAIVADSQATKDDMVQLLGVPAQRVTVVYPGIGPQFRPLPPEETEPVRVQLGLPERFILFVSTIEPRKNLVRLVEAFAELEARGLGLEASSNKVGNATSENSTTSSPSLQPLAAGLALVLAGRKGWMYEPVFETIARLGLGGRVQVLDFVDDSHLPIVYNLAEVFAYPSIYEGFGFPPLEALACGTVVVASNSSSLPEALGDAALLVPPSDVGAIAAALERALGDEQLRSELRAAGPAQARQFEWNRAARQLLELYRS
jgi:glycosyltransferase involved in cell wall biosynthesis